MRGEARRQLHAFVDIPSAGGPVGGGEAHEERGVVGPDGAHGVDHLEGEADAVLERAAVRVVPVIGERGEELVQEVAVRGVHLDHLKSGVARAARGVAEGGDDVGDPCRA